MFKAALCISWARNEHQQVPSVNRRTFESRSVGDITTVPLSGTGPERPKNADYATYTARMASFRGCECRNVDVHDLVCAGFYYTGIKDYVRCFQCGGGIKDWEAGDQPWIEHARWYPNCPYVKQTLGEDFARLSQSSEINDRQQSEILLARVRQENQTRILDQDHVIRDLHSTAARIVLGMGYSQAHVTEAIRHARNKYGSGTLGAQQLLEYLIDHCAVNSTFSTNSSSRHIEASEPVNRSPASRSVSGTNDESHSNGNEPEPSSLLEENRQLKEQKLCKICLDKEACIVFIPCGHLASCIQCSTSLRSCVICRSNIQQKVRVFSA